MRIIDHQDDDLPSLNETGGELLSPPLLSLDVLSVEKLGRTLSLVASNDNAHTTTLQVASSERTNSAKATRTEVDGMRSSLGEVGRFRPVNGLSEDLLAQRASQRARH